MNMILRESRMSLPHVEPDALREEMSSLFSVLTQLIDEQGSIVLHVTSTRQGEGTTTIARGLAAVAACSKWC
jgi:predicted Ser/Thr protein kinase